MPLHLEGEEVFHPLLGLHVHVDVLTLYLITVHYALHLCILGEAEDTTLHMAEHTTINQKWITISRNPYRFRTLQLSRC